MRFAYLGLGLLAACTNGSSHDTTVHLPPNNGGIHPVGHVPSIGQTLLFGGAGSFTFIGPLAPGSATYTDAPAFDPETGMGPDHGGTGSFSVSINGTPYSGSIDSVALTFNDPMEGDYVALDGYTMYTGPGGVDWVNEITVIVKRSDFAIGTPIALDGNDRVALFAAGPADAQNPQIVGAAITGSVTFTAGDLTGVVSGTVSGDFGQIDWVPDQPPTGNITAGSYDLAIAGPGEAYCDGTLAGHEASFASITAASLGLGDATVAVATPSPSVVTVTGAPGFAGDFELDAQDEALYAGFTNESGAGPEGTTLAGKYLVFDGASASPMFVNGGAGAGYMTADGSGTCTVAFGATLTAH